MFNGWDAQEGRTASACQILSNSLKPRLRYGDFSIFQDGGRPPAWIFKSWKFQLPVAFGGPICVTVPKFREDWSNHSGDMADFRFFKMADAAIGFWKFEIFNGWDGQEARTASACQMLSKSLKPRLRYGDFSIFQAVSYTHLTLPTILRV